MHVRRVCLYHVSSSAYGPNVPAAVPPTSTLGAVGLYAIARSGDFGSRSTSGASGRVQFQM